MFSAHALIERVNQVSARLSRLETTLEHPGFTAASTLHWVSAPASASSTGTAGQVAYDGSYFYVCVATDTWIRGLATW